MPAIAVFRDLIGRVRRREAQRRTLQDFRRSLVLIVDPKALVASVSNRLKELFDPDRLIVYELQPRDEFFSISLAHGVTEASLERIADSLPANGRLTRWFRVNETCLQTAVHQEVVDFLDPRERNWLASSGCQVCAPMMAKNQLIGLILLGFDRPSTLGRRDTELLLEFADQASLAFQNAALYREQQERLVRLHRTDRLASMGQLAAGVAHEVRNPLTAIRSTMQYLSSSLEMGGKEMVEELIEEVDRIDHIISSLLNLSRSGELERQEVDLVDVIGQTVRLIDIRARKENVRIVEQLAPSLPVEVDPGQIKQVLLNLLLNSLQAISDHSESGSILIEAEVERTYSALRRVGWVRILVADDGPGVAPEILGSLLDPFFTTKSEGTGLGLSVCHNIIEQHGGKLELEGAPNEGLRVKILLPLSGRLLDSESGVIDRPSSNPEHARKSVHLTS